MGFNPDNLVKRDLPFSRQTHFTIKLNPKCKICREALQDANLFLSQDLEVFLLFRKERQSFNYSHISKIITKKISTQIKYTRNKKSSISHILDSVTESSH